MAEREGGRKRRWQKGKAAEREGDSGSPCSQHERSAAVLGAVLDVRPVLEQQGDDAVVALPAGRGEGDVVVGATRSVDSCSGLQQQLSHLRNQREGPGRRGKEHCTHSRVLKLKPA